MTRILLVDDDGPHRQSLARALRRSRCEVRECFRAEDALVRLSQERFDVVLADLCLPGMSGMDLLRELALRVPPPIVLILTGHVSIESAVAAIRGGARDYLIKPIPVKTLLQRISLILRPPKIRSEHRPADIPSRQPDGLSTELVGTSRTMQDLQELILKVAPASSSVLITGETGTGKELVARSIHRAGPRRERPFLSVNCSAIPASLLESHLFGYVRGAFSGAEGDRRGLIDAAGDGTLFLDEIGELPVSLQPKLLRALDAREFLPVGSTETRPVASRVLAATHRDLKDLVRLGRFREDLYFRLTTLEVPIAPLRERVEDIEITARYLIDRTARSMGRVAPALSTAALAALEHYPWPGNVRELSNILERAMILGSSETIRIDDLPTLLSPTPTLEEGNLQTAKRTFERTFILRAVNTHKGDKAAAAKSLGISLTSLYRKLGMVSRTSIPKPG